MVLILQGLLKSLAVGGAIGERFWPPKQIPLAIVAPHQLKRVCLFLGLNPLSNRLQPKRPRQNNDSRTNLERRGIGCDIVDQRFINLQ